jgi:hypothetical protein
MTSLVCNFLAFRGKSPYVLFMLLEMDNLQYNDVNTELMEARKNGVHYAMQGKLELLVQPVDRQGMEMKAKRVWKCRQLKSAFREFGE